MSQSQWKQSNGESKISKYPSPLLAYIDCMENHARKAIFQMYPKPPLRRSLPKFARLPHQPRTWPRLQGTQRPT